MSKLSWTVHVHVGFDHTKIFKCATNKLLELRNEANAKVNT